MDHTSGSRGKAMYQIGGDEGDGKDGLRRWYLITPGKIAKDAMQFLGQMKIAAKGMSFHLSEPRVYVFHHFHYDSFVHQHK